jgi:hypothetical protein
MVKPEIVASDKRYLVVGEGNLPLAGIHLIWASGRFQTGGE